MVGKNIRYQKTPVDWYGNHNTERVSFHLKNILRKCENQKYGPLDVDRTAQN